MSFKVVQDTSQVGNVHFMQPLNIRFVLKTSIFGGGGGLSCYPPFPDEKTLSV